MFRQVEDLKSYEVIGSDGEVGKVEDFLFDDKEWYIRELVVRTGGWLTGRNVVLLPHSVTGIDSTKKAIGVSLSKKQIEDAPPPPYEAEGILSRYYETALYDYYHAPYY